MGACCSNDDNVPVIAEDEEKICDSVPKIDVMLTYTLGRTLGSGASCRVVVGRSKENLNDRVAVKIMDKDRAITGKLYKREVNVLQRLTPDPKHPFHSILPFIAHGEDDDAYFIVTQLLSGGELFDRIVSKDKKYIITEKVACKLMLSMLEAVKFCHDHGVVHRDLKPENFVFASKAVESDVVLIDYGCALALNDEEIVEDVVGTAYYLAPELAAAALDNYRKKGRNINPKVPPPQPRTGRILCASDVWSMGVIAYVMMTGRAPFRGRDNAAIFESTCCKKLLFPEKDARYHNKLSLSDHFKDFCRKVLVKDPLQRLPIQECIRHPWVQGIEAKAYALNKDVIHYLRQFSYQSKLKKEITRVLATNMTERPAEQVQKHFNRLDADGDGFLDTEELTYLLLDMGYSEHAAGPESLRILKNADLNKDGVIDFSEFKQVWYRKVLTNNDAYIHRVFDVFDDNGDGHIDAQELGQILFPAEFEQMELQGSDEAPTNNNNNAQDDVKEADEAGAPATEYADAEEFAFLESVKRMISEVDVNGDQRIDFDEFKSAMKEDLQGGAAALESLISGQYGI